MLTASRQTRLWARAKYSATRSPTRTRTALHVHAARRLGRCGRRDRQAQPDQCPNPFQSHASLETTPSRDGVDTSPGRA